MSRFFPVETPQTAALEEGYAHLKSLFAHYATDCEELAKHRHAGVSGAVRHYLSMDETQNAPIHKAFYTEVQSCVEALAAGLAEYPCETLAREAAQLFFRPKTPDMDQNQRGWLIAAEPLVLPLLPHLSTEAAEEFCSCYEGLYRWNQMMPRQRELYTALCQRIGKRVQKPGLLAGLFGKGH